MVARPCRFESGLGHSMPKAKLPKKDFVWSSKLAYIIGLLVTDGNLSKDKRHISMRSSDHQLLETFKHCLDLTNKIGSTENDRGYRVQFGNIQFYNWLLKIGLFPTKTYTIGAIEIPNKFFRDFLRGHLDGDGNIQTYIDRRETYKGRVYTNYRVFVRFISASKNHILWLHKKIKELSPVSGVAVCTKPKNENCVPIWGVKFGKHESIQLLRWIYYRKNLPTLLRKRKLAEELIQRVKKEKRKKYTFVE